jgi:hypothetical protein
MTGTSDLDRFTNGGITSRQERLPGALRDLHRAVLGRFLATGAAPTARWLKQAAADLGLGPDAAAALAAADVVHLSNGLVTVAYPFSGTPTPHRVELDDTPAVYAMCAIDALGLPAMTGRDGRITSAEPLDGQPVQVTVRDGAFLPLVPSDHRHTQVCSGWHSASTTRAVSRRTGPSSATALSVRSATRRDVVARPDDQGPEVHRAHDVVHHPRRSLVNDAPVQVAPPGEKVASEASGHVHNRQDYRPHRGMVKNDFLCETTRKPTAPFLR